LDDSVFIRFIEYVVGAHFLDHPVVNRLLSVRTEHYTKHGLTEINLLSPIFINMKPSMKVKKCINRCTRITFMDHGIKASITQFRVSQRHVNTAVV